MSSGAIMGQICSCQNQLQNIQQELQKAQLKLDNQMKVKAEYMADRSEFEVWASDVQKRGGQISAHAGANKFAKRFVLDGDPILFGGRLGAAKSGLAQIQSCVEKAIQESELKISELKMQIQNMQSHISNLWGQYHQACQWEAEEAARAAAMA